VFDLARVERGGELPLVGGLGGRGEGGVGDGVVVGARELSSVPGFDELFEVVTGVFS